TPLTAVALILYTLGIPFIAGIRNVAAVFYAYKDAKMPMVASLASVVLTIALNVMFIGILGFWIFPLSTSLAAAFKFWLLARALPKKIGRVEMRPLVGYTLALTGAALVGGAAAWLGNMAFVRMLGTRFWATLASVAVNGSLGLVVFYGVSRLFGIGETRDFVRRFLKR
ncbi:MAG: lipid II flippase MurJ, partial [Acidobacteriota bacterium]